MPVYKPSDNIRSLSGHRLAEQVPAELGLYHPLFQRREKSGEEKTSLAVQNKDKNSQIELQNSTKLSKNPFSELFLLMSFFLCHLSHLLILEFLLGTMKHFLISQLSETQAFLPA